MTSSRHAWILTAALGLAACTDTQPAADTQPADDTAATTEPRSAVTETPSTSIDVETPSIPADDENPEADADVGACSGEVATVETEQYRSIDGVDPDLLSLDVHAPARAEACPAVIWVHGGGWRIGDKSTRSTRVKASHFVGEGYVFVSVNYRLAAPDNDVRWPDFGSDVAAAAAWVIDSADEFGVDPERVALVGHSSGAHLTAIVGTNPALLGEFGLQRDDLACVVVLDTEAFDLDDPTQRRRDIVVGAFDDDTDLLVDGSPLRQAVEHRDDGPLAPFLLVVRGRERRIGLTNDFADALRSVGASAEVVDANPYSHADVNVELGVAGESVVTPAVTQFLASCPGR